ncbi:MAG TPA: DNA-processing protein DprA [Bacillota bacterium]|nr:DNA-processing protein DprA [Bacillota bacterium]
MDDRLFWLGWQMLWPGAGRKIWELVEYFGSPKSAWEAGEKELLNVAGIGEKALAGVLKRRSEIDLAEEVSRLEKRGIQFVVHTDPAYPENLLKIFDPPPVIFVRGTMKPDDSLAVAVVGTRKPSPYGRAVAEKITRDLAAVGITVVSGMARGIDTAAHVGALSGGGRTIAVLGCGPDVAYPRENSGLMERIARQGAIVSEFPPGSPPESWHFPVRNRIISGLSLGTLVVEAAERSGALITADYALEQGRDVMAVPGSITSTLSRGPHRLIKQGARLVEGTGDILDEIGLEKIFPLPGPEGEGTVKMSEDERAIYGHLAYDPVSLDELIIRSGLLPQKVMAALMYLELKGLTRQLPGKLYARSGRLMF